MERCACRMIAAVTNRYTSRKYVTLLSVADRAPTTDSIRMQIRGQVNA